MRRCKARDLALGPVGDSPGMLPPPDKDEVRPQSVKAWRDINPLTPSYEVIYLYRNGDELRPFDQHLLIDRIHELAPDRERPRG